MFGDGPVAPGLPRGKKTEPGDHEGKNIWGGSVGGYKKLWADGGEGRLALQHTNNHQGNEPDTKKNTSQKGGPGPYPQRKRKEKRRPFNHGIVSNYRRAQGTTTGKNKESGESWQPKCLTTRENSEPLPLWGTTKQKCIHDRMVVPG